MCEDLGLQFLFAHFATSAVGLGGALKGQMLSVDPRDGALTRLRGAANGNTRWWRGCAWPAWLARRAFPAGGAG